MALRLLLSLALWTALVGSAQASEATRERLVNHFQVGEFSFPSWVRLEHRMGDAFDLELPTDPGEKAKGELPSLGKVLLALAIGDAWQSGDDAVHLVPWSERLDPSLIRVVPNARAPPPRR